MTDVNPDLIVPPLPTKRQDRLYLAKLVGLALAAVVATGLTVAVVLLTSTNSSQQALLAKNNRAAECRSQLTAVADGAAYDGINALLDAVVLLGNRQTLDFEQIASVSNLLKEAKSARLTAVEDCK